MSMVKFWIFEPFKQMHKEDETCNYMTCCALRTAGKNLDHVLNDELFAQIDGTTNAVKDVVGNIYLGTIWRATNGGRDNLVSMRNEPCLCRYSSCSV